MQGIAGDRCTRLLTLLVQAPYTIFKRAMTFARALSQLIEDIGSLETPFLWMTVSAGLLVLYLLQARPAGVCLRFCSQPM